MRDKDVKGLLEHFIKDLLEIKKKYYHSLNEKEIPFSLRIDVKNAMENVRSAIDYIAQDILDIVINPYRKNKSLKLLKRCYFPFGKDEKSFRESIGNNLPDLEKIRLDIYLLIDAIQPHACGNPWLYDFCKILNTNKHNTLSPQTRTSMKTYRLGTPGSGAIIEAQANSIHAPPGMISIGNIPIEFDQNTGIPKEKPGLEISVITWVNFVFEGTLVEVFPLLNISFNKVRELSTQIYQLI